MSDRPTALLPIPEGRLVAPIVDGSHEVEVGLAADDILQRAVFEPAGASPVPAVLGGEDLGGEVAVCAHCLLNRRHPSDAELRNELWILESKPGHGRAPSFPSTGWRRS
jgi:hypothetical protein